jgi:hypothetical protein
VADGRRRGARRPVIVLGGFVWLSVKDKIVPYVVKVDSLGATLAIKLAKPAGRPADGRAVRALRHRALLGVGVGTHQECVTIRCGGPTRWEPPMRHPGEHGRPGYSPPLRRHGHAVRGGRLRAERWWLRHASTRGSGVSDRGARRTRGPGRSSAESKHAALGHHAAVIVANPRRPDDEHHHGDDRSGLGLIR